MASVTRIISLNTSPTWRHRASRSSQTFLRGWIWTERSSSLSENYNQWTISLRKISTRRSKLWCENSPRKPLLSYMRKDRRRKGHHWEKWLWRSRKMKSYSEPGWTKQESQRLLRLMTTAKLKWVARTHQQLSAKADQIWMCLVCTDHKEARHPAPPSKNQLWMATRQSTQRSRRKSLIRTTTSWRSSRCVQD